MSSGNTSENRFKEWLESLDPERRRDMEKLWHAAEDTDESSTISLSEEEKKEAFANIALQTGLHQPDAKAPADSFSKTKSGWTWIAAAAAIILAAGLSYLAIPIKVSAPPGEMLTVSLPDNSTVTLNSGSTLSYSRLNSFWDREHSLEGEAFFDVKKGEQPFIVHTSNASVKVLGTSFNMRSWQSDPGSETSVVLTEGSLAFYPSGKPDQSVVLKPGEKSKIASNQQLPTKPALTATDKDLAWLDNRFAFENMQIAQIIRELERRFALSITVDTEEILSDSLTIYYNNEVSAELIIRDICQSKALTYRKVNRGFVIEAP